MIPQPDWIIFPQTPDSFGFSLGTLNLLLVSANLPNSKKECRTKNVNSSLQIPLGTPHPFHWPVESDKVVHLALISSLLSSPPSHQTFTPFFRKFSPTFHGHFLAPTLLRMWNMQMTLFSWLVHTKHFPDFSTLSNTLPPESASSLMAQNANLLLSTALFQSLYLSMLTPTEPATVPIVLHSSMSLHARNLLHSLTTITKR